MIGSIASAQDAASQSAKVLDSAGRVKVNVFVGLLDRSIQRRLSSLDAISKHWDVNDSPMLVEVARFLRDRRSRQAITDLLADKTGQDFGIDLNAWSRWMWNQEIETHPNYALFKQRIYQRIDPRFAEYFEDEFETAIRLDEIRWGGVRRDGIPPLKDPKTIPVDQAGYLADSDVVFGVEFGGVARAYPKRILAWHEMVKDTVGGQSINGVYCTLCGSMIVYDPVVEGKHYELGTSGFLYRSNKLMYDTETNSLWNQFTGKPVVGKLVGSGIELKTRPVVITSWTQWSKQHPDTRVLSLRTGFSRDYKSGKPYSAYFSSPKLMFPALVDETKLKAKDYVFALRGSGHQKAWPLSYFKIAPVINDTAGALQITLVGDPATRTVRAYRTRGQRFAPGPATDTLAADGQTWQVTETAIRGPDGQALTRLPGHIAYWFAWSNYFGAQGDLAQRPDTK